MYYATNAPAGLKRDVMQLLASQDICVFCPPHVDIRVVRRTDHWRVAPNDFPYPGTDKHLLLIPAEHVDSIFKLSSQAQAQLWELLHGLAAGWPHFSLFVRCGDAAYTGATVAHLHLHLVVAATTDGVHLRLG